MYHICQQRHSGSRPVGQLGRFFFSTFSKKILTIRENGCVGGSGLYFLVASVKQMQ